MRKEVIGQMKLAKIITNKLNGSINYDRVYAAIKIIKLELIRMLIEDIPVTVKNFGTLSPYFFHGHKAGRWGKKMQEIKKFRLVKLNPHQSFQELIKEKRDFFKKKK